MNGRVVIILLAVLVLCCMWSSTATAAKHPTLDQVKAEIFKIVRKTKGNTYKMVFELATYSNKILKMTPMKNFPVKRKNWLSRVFYFVKNGFKMFREMTAIGKRLAKNKNFLTAYATTSKTSSKNDEKVNELILSVRADLDKITKRAYDLAPELVTEMMGMIYAYVSRDFLPNFVSASMKLTRPITKQVASVGVLQGTKIGNTEEPLYRKNLNCKVDCTGFTYKGDNLFGSCKKNTISYPGIVTGNYVEDGITKIKYECLNDEKSVSQLATSNPQLAASLVTQLYKACSAGYFDAHTNFISTLCNPTEETSSAKQLLQEGDIAKVSEILSDISVTPTQNKETKTTDESVPFLTLNDLNALLNVILLENDMLMEIMVRTYHNPENAIVSVLSDSVAKKLDSFSSSSTMVGVEKFNNEIRSLVGFKCPQYTESETKNISMSEGPFPFQASTLGCDLLKVYSKNEYYRLLEQTACLVYKFSDLYNVMENRKSFTVMYSNVQKLFKWNLQTITKRFNAIGLTDGVQLVKQLRDSYVKTDPTQMTPTAFCTNLIQQDRLYPLKKYGLQLYQKYL